MNNFDLKKFLTENKLTSNSRALNEQEGLNVHQELVNAGVDVDRPIVYLAIAGHRPLFEPKTIEVADFISTVNREAEGGDAFVDTNPEILDQYSTGEYVDGDMTAKIVFNVDEVDHIVYQ